MASSQYCMMGVGSSIPLIVSLGQIKVMWCPDNSPQRPKRKCILLISGEPKEDSRTSWKALISLPLERRLKRLARLILHPSFSGNFQLRNGLLSFLAEIKSYSLWHTWGISGVFPHLQVIFLPHVKDWCLNDAMNIHSERAVFFTRTQKEHQSTKRMAVKDIKILFICVIPAVLYFSEKLLWNVKQLSYSFRQIFFDDHISEFSHIK